MNDKEAFKKWMENNTNTQKEIEAYQAMSEKDRIMFSMEYTWQAACAYKQEEITLLENQISYLEETIDSFMDEPDIVIKKLQADKVKLRGKLKIAVDALVFYSDLDDEAIGYDIRGVTYAREALKAINED